MNSPAVVQSYRTALFASGYKPIPVRTASKVPLERGWPDSARSPRPPCIDAWPSNEALSTGILCDGLVAVDCDCDDPALASEIERIAKQLLGNAPKRFRHSSPRFLLLYASSDSSRVYRSVKGILGAVDCLARGRQFVADGLHERTKEPYYWDDPIERVSPSRLTVVTPEMVDAFREVAAGIVGAGSPKTSDQERVVNEPFVERPIPTDAELRIAKSVVDQLYVELSAMTKGQGRNAALNAAALQMGELCAGWGIDHVPVGLALMQASTDNGYIMQDGYDAAKATLESGFTKGWSQPRPRHIEVEVLPLPFLNQQIKTAWPKELGPQAYYGIPGDFVRLVAPQTEGDPAALLLAMLTVIGASIGRNAYLPVGPTKHHGNLFTCIVAETSKGRKGTVMAEAKRFVGLVDPSLEDRTVSGLSSGEGLIEAVRDPREEDVPVKEGGRVTGHQRQVVDTGVLDKRLLVTEGELGNALQVAGRDGNTLSATLRLAWDGDELRTLARSNKNVCREPHICIFGNITVDELQRLLTATDRANGFGNRFLWCCAKRSQLLAFGGMVDVAALQALAMRTAHAIVQSQQYGIMGWLPESVQLWHTEYARLSAGLPGMTGALCARAEAQALRLALIYAILDGSQNIAPAHLRAALELWRYCEDSVRYIFGTSSGNEIADEIVAFLRMSNAGATLTQISGYFGRNKTSDELRRALDALKTTNRITEATHKTGGRPSSIYRAV